MDFASGAPRLLEAFARPELRIRFLGFHDLFVAHLCSVLLLRPHLHLAIVHHFGRLSEGSAVDVATFHSLQRCLAEVERAILVDTQRVLVPVHTTLVQVKALLLDSAFFLVVFNEIVLHKLRVTARTADHLGHFIG